MIHVMSYVQRRDQNTGPAMPSIDPTMSSIAVSVRALGEMQENTMLWDTLKIKLNT
jgi:hypothetical protein